MVYDPSNKPENPYARYYADFLGETNKHVLKVSLDDGLNRRFRVGSPETSIWSWHVVTWPGYLATFGDIADGFMFSRDTDMITFFDRGGHGEYYSDGAPSIDFRYWAQKLSGTSRDVLEFSSAAFMKVVTESLEEHDELGNEAQETYDNIIEATRRVCQLHDINFDEYIAELRKRGDSRYTLLEIDPEDELQSLYYGQEIPERSPAERRADVLEEAQDHSDNEHAAYEWLGDSDEVEDVDDWNVLRDYNVHFLFACWAIEFSVKLWREYEKSNDAKALAIAAQETASGLVKLARSRVDEQFKITTHGELGEASNGALLVRLADALAEQIGARPAYVPQPLAEKILGDSYVYVAGGLVQNEPALPVFDLDILDGSTDEASAAEALDLYRRISQHPQASVDLIDEIKRLAAFVQVYGAPADSVTVEAIQAHAEPEDETCRLCNGSGRIATGRAGVNPPKVTCPECKGARTLPVDHHYEDDTI